MLTKKIAGWLAVSLGGLFSMVGAQVVVADWQDDIGWTKLKAEMGDLLEDGTGLSVVQVEAPSGDAYLPDTSLDDFLGKTFIDGTATNAGSSSHSTGVARNFFSRSRSIAPGIMQITGYDANDYLDRVLGHGSGADPLPQGFDVGNHSYVGNLSDKVAAQDILQRFDFIIDRDNTVMTVGVNNGSTKKTPHLLAHSYNAIAVGRLSGDHSRGATTFYGVGRYKPDIVAGDSATSFTAPRVAGAAAILKQAAAGTNGTQAVAIRSLLFAGATKDEFSDWTRASSQPIDEVFGFGELNIYNSYHILEAGEFNGAINPFGNSVGRVGWDLGSANGVDNLFYEFEVNEANPIVDLSVALTWNIKVIDSDDSTDIFNASTELANLDLALLDPSGNVLDESISTVSNSEHIFLNELGPGLYRLRVSSDTAAEFGLAWRMTSVPEPTGGFCFVCMSLVILCHRQKRNE